MIENVSCDTSDFEQVPAWTPYHVLDTESARGVCERIDHHGFAIVPNVFSASDAELGLQLVKAAIEDPDRTRATFASNTDIRYRRRDFCALPSSPEVIDFASKLCARLAPALREYCGSQRPVLEISSFTSNDGCSHQYLHRDPPGVLSMFVAVDNVSPEQGGTLFVPGTHMYSGAELGMEKRRNQLMKDFQVLINCSIFAYNYRKVRKMWRKGPETMSRDEFLARTFSRVFDDHQPNILRFLLCKNFHFNARLFKPATVLRLYRERSNLRKTFRLIQAAPRQGSVIIYRSDMLHAGPDNMTKQPRYFFGLSLARDVIHPEMWRAGYTPHPSLLENSIKLGDFIGQASREMARA
jgi:ectoine hydroxylase-related dioxygenase (phytanoyl-CoA dioxygenase family)